MTPRVRELYAGLRWRVLAAVAVTALAVSAILALSRPIVVFVDGERVYSDVAPVTAGNDKAFVPLRSVADALGAEIDEDGKTGTTDVVLGGQWLQLRAGDEHARLNGIPFTLKRAPFLVRGRVLVSLEAVARALGVRAKYDARSARIEVTTPGIGLGP